ncbi:hypothetical protein QN355_11745 [Cryobacterium sp. 10S3]|uniref:hypothetical protein n=1 Tax=Cryobacterium sp. 10S3 TaxID=3048582 RepID=UPI002AC8BFD7|nr:hypothetical protein [Cryobacterium sp. 10S3]MEB0287227.1 hypothetical protein [Cryobacterium sp. 10S3]WPX14182.1 hypothetical protein RHM57_02065 [Cryobacterium sp. 10S3]
MIDLFHVCDVARNQAVGTNGRKQFSSLYTAVPSLFLPMSAQAAIQNGYSVGFAWDIYVDDGTDIQIGDKLTYSGQTYIVRGRQPYAGLPIVSHLHLMAETEHANGQ